MTKVLIVDDSPVDRLLAGKLLEKCGDVTVVYAGNGREALAAIARDKPAAVLTDLQMPEMDGLELVLAIRAEHPEIPVILTTAHGSEEIAVRALQAGAASYVPKRKIPQDLCETLDTVLEAAQAKLRHARLMECLTQTESHFVLDNDPELIPPLVGHLRDVLALMTSTDETALLRVTIAVREAALNAVEHGNLELDSALRESDCAAYHRLGAERRQQVPYRDRRVYVTARVTPAEAVFVLRDEGPGFDPTRLPDPCDPDNLGQVSGRGLLLVRTFMTEVRHNARGNEITLIWRRAPEPPAQPPTAAAPAQKDAPV
jgi:CheY-like chemotaxis protein/anti-sigma regulatory factor (Ser/Thr protein kinase)